MDRRLSCQSDSSVEPMDISKTSSLNHTNANSTATTDASPASASSSVSSSAHLALFPHSAGDLFAPPQRRPAEARRRRCTEDDNEHEEDDDDDESAGRISDGVVRRENLRKKYRHIKANSNGPDYDDDDDDDRNGGIDLRRVKPEAPSAEDLSATAPSTAAAQHPQPANARVSGQQPQQPAQQYTCPICEHVSGTQHDFTEHIRTHNNVSEDGQHYVCRICDKVLSSSSSLDRHVLVHTGERPFNCKYCHLTFTTNGNMHRHIRTHQQRGDIPALTNNNSNSHNHNSISNGHPQHIRHHNQHHPHSNYQQQQQQHPNNLHQANLGDTDSDAVSSDSCRSPNNNNTHSQNHNHHHQQPHHQIHGHHQANSQSTGNFKRKISYDETSSAGDAKRPHKTTINNNHIIDGGLGDDGASHLSCPVCGRSEFVSMPQLDAHMDREHPGIQAKCRGCEAVFKSHKALSAHKCPASANVVHGFKDLAYMDFSADKFPLIARTICENPVRMAIGTPRFECRKCPRAFPCASSLDIHARTCDGFVGSPPQRPTMAPPDFSARSRNPSETSEEDARRDDFFAHLDLKNKAADSSAGTAFSPLSQMDTSYGSLDKSSPAPAVHIKQERLTGMQNFHPNRLPARPHGAYDMGRDLADIQSMINVSANGVGFMHQHQHLFDPHMQRSPLLGHLPMTPKEQQSGGSVTSGCDRRDEPEEAQDAEFTAEFRKMKLRGEFPCKLCPAVFPNLRALKGHNRIHVSESGAGPFRCNMCPYSIHDKQALVRHMRTHNGDRPYECAICNYAFTTKANCERHLRNRHAKTTRDEVKRAIIYHPSEDSSCDDPVKKMQIYNASYDDVSPMNSTPDDLISPKLMRSVTPLSHLKEILTPPSEKSVKIQVKSIDQLTWQQQQPESDEPQRSTHVNRAMDFSSDDALDLSKKPDSNSFTPKWFDDEPLDEPSQNGHRAFSPADDQKRAEQPPSAPASVGAPVPLPPAMPKMEFAMKSHPLLFQQHPLLNEIDPSHYLQLSQFYRNLIFPGSNFGLHPAMFLPPAFLPPVEHKPNDLPGLFAGLPPPLQHLSQSAPFASAPQQHSPAPATVAAPPAAASPFKREPVVASSPHPLHQQPSSNHSSDSPHRPLSMPTQQELTQRMNSLHQAAAVAAAAAAAASHSPLAMQNQNASGPGSGTPSDHHQHHLGHQQQQHHHNLQQQHLQQQPQPSITNTGPVKMVIKNGVLMPKQKQRRYRTERPFACEHCSARFTLRSNMERHIKQQHPQYWAQRQRGASAPMPTASQQQPPAHHHLNGSSGMPLMPSQLISDQVKYAILAQQLKSRSNGPADSKLIPQVGDLESYFPHHLQSHAQSLDQQPLDQQPPYEKWLKQEDTANEYYAQMRERERELQLQQKLRAVNGGDDEPDFDRTAIDDDDDEAEDEDDDNGSELVIDEDSEPEDLSALTKTPPPATATPSATAKLKPEQADENSTGDLVPVSKLIDNASIPFGGYFPMASKNVDVAASAAANVAVAIDHSDEEGLVASGSSASESNNSGAEENGGRASSSRRRVRSPSSSSSSGAHASGGGANKKKSAYSLAPNRVSCPYCQRMFPWTSSLRRHILTHTGQKPFKCSHCPLLFTTKSNCDRHLLRKHGDVESAQSLYVPLEDVADSALTGRMIVMADRDEDDDAVVRSDERDDEPAGDARQIVEPICSVRTADDDHEDDDEDEDEDEDEDDAHAVKPEVQNCVETELASVDGDRTPAERRSPDHIESSAVLASSTPKPATEAGPMLAAINSELLPFKCHLCDGSFADRVSCLDHIKLVHAQDFELLLSKGAIDTDVSSDPQQTLSAEDDEQHQPQQQQGAKSGGKYPDYANRKVMCAFCMRRFWSTEDLRRHMRTHSGERPFQCQICQRRFTLKHSMLRHQKKHAHRQHQQQQQHQHLQKPAPNSASDLSDEDTMSGTPPPPSTGASPAPRAKIMPELIPKELSWKFQLEHGENLVAALQKTHFFRAAAAAAAAAAASGGDDATGASGDAVGHHHHHHHHGATSDLIGNLLGISDQSMLSQVLRSSADEAAKLLGVEK